MNASPQILTDTSDTIQAACDAHNVHSAIDASWAMIAPFWPLKNLVAANPLAGFEHMAFEDALAQAQAYFQQADIPDAMQNVNRETIKWLQAFFDEGQATIAMPQRHKGLLASILTMLPYDTHATGNIRENIVWVNQLTGADDAIIAQCLLRLGIDTDLHELFLTLMLTTLPGWAAYVCYRTDWADATDAAKAHQVTKSSYLALRLVLTCLLFPDAKALIQMHDDACNASDIRATYDKMQASEQSYQQELLSLVRSDATAQMSAPDAQLVFCIDVRSEPFRRALEAQGNYDTYGYAGFFGVPVAIENEVTGDVHASCPVLLKPAHTIIERPDMPTCRTRQHMRMRGFKRLYQSMKYTFAAPFVLVETMGVVNGLWMGMRSFAPDAAYWLKSRFHAVLKPTFNVTPEVGAIPFEQQVHYAKNALTTLGLTENFASLVVLCGHGSSTENNAYATALDCGACGGRHGAPNARILAAMLNSTDVRQTLTAHDIHIADTTWFIAAKHDTTTDSVTLFDQHVPDRFAQNMAALTSDLMVAKATNSQYRAHEMDANIHQDRAASHTMSRSCDWAQVRPEWGLAGNAAFIIAPRDTTRHVDLGGRAFLHSYDWTRDDDGAVLTAILTAPMVVTQWINNQYLFSALDNVAFGGGSKITKNITGKIGIMQGNASDLMHGLPLQSVNKSDIERYHDPLRLSVLVKAPRARIDSIIAQHEILQTLFGNGWVHLLCHDPDADSYSHLQRNLQWNAA